MSIHVLMDRIKQMEAEAKPLQEWGAGNEAGVLLHACERFRTILQEWLDEALTIGQAAEEYPRWKERTIAEKLRQGDLPQAGAHGEPLVRRGDLFGLVEIVPDDLAAWAEDMIDG